jgi:hypothetical protein
MHSGSVNKYSFANPVGARKYEDGRDRFDKALKKIFAAGPQRPDSLAKRDRSDAALNAALAKKLNRQERLRRSNAAEALEEVRKVHAAGGRRGLDEAKGDPEFPSRSVNMVKRARQHAVPVTENRLPNPIELNKLFADQTREIDVDNIQRYGGYASRFRAMTKAERRAWKGLGTARPRANDTGVTDNYGHGAPESLNGQWNDVHAATGASNNFRDMAVPSERPTIIGSQTTATPSALTRDAAIDAIKRALRSPQKMWGNSDLDEDEDEDEADDEDEDEDEDDDDDEDSGTSNAKNPNRDDARR